MVVIGEALIIFGAFEVGEYFLVRPSRGEFIPFPFVIVGGRPAGGFER
jgi:hypothetical protein